MGFQFIRRAAGAAGLLFVAGLVPAAIQAQVVVRGILYDDATGLPVRGAVMLVDPATDAPIAHVRADSAGQFALQTREGTYQIAAVFPGYTSVLSAPIGLENGEQMTVHVPIATSGDPTHQIAVVQHVKPAAHASVRDDHSRLRAFEARRALGTGLHFDAAQIAHAHVATLGEFLQNVPGLSVTDPGTTSSMSMVRSSASFVSNNPNTANACHIAWFVDGRRIDLPGMSDPITQGLGMMTLDSVIGIEVFRGLSELPPEFADPDVRCGAVAVWTKE
jgi:hypothetical protein